MNIKKSQNIQTQSKQLKQKTIRGKINGSILTFLIPSLIVLIVVSCILAARTVSSLNTSILQAQSNDAVNRVDNFFTEKITAISMFQYNARLQNYLSATHSPDDINSYADTKNVAAMLGKALDSMSSEGVQAAWFSGIQNNTYLMDDGSLVEANYDSVDWDELILKDKKPVVSEPFVDPATDKVVISVVAPIFSIDEKEVIGFAGFDVFQDKLGEEISTIKIGKDGFLDLISSDNYYIYSEDTEVMNKSVTEVSGLDQQFANKIVNNQTGVVTYDYDGIAYRAVIQALNTNDWLSIANIPVNEINATRDQLIVILGILAIVITIILTIAISIITKRITAPLAPLTNGIREFSEGNLGISIDVKTNDEIGVLADNIRYTITSLQSIIEDISSLLSEISRGNLNLSVKGNYIGDFKPIQNAFTTILDSLNDTLGQIKESSSQVSMGASQMAESAQSLAEGATDQAGSVEELQATITDITGKVEQTAELGKEAYEKAKEVKSKAQISSNEMRDMTGAMEKIQETSNQIAGIIAEIEDIASQTNLLSLNAAIEAARAGDAGRGFAVVAEQIRKLAEDSAASAVNTRRLIESALNEVGTGSQISERTALSLGQVVNGLNEIAESVQKSSEASLEQAESMKQIEQGVDQISGVIQNNSAVAEESSATSEELSAQAENLDDLVGRFELRKNVK